MGNNRFATAPSVAPAEETSERTRIFEGDGSSFLRVAGLKSLEGVAVGTTRGRQVLPLEEVRKQLASADENEPRETVSEPLFELQGAGTEEATLVRSVLSNDGKFQKRTTFYVTGDWEAPNLKSEEVEVKEVAPREVIKRRRV